VIASLRVWRRFRLVKRAPFVRRVRVHEVVEKDEYGIPKADYYCRSMTKQCAYCAEAIAMSATLCPKCNKSLIPRSQEDTGAFSQASRTFAPSGPSMPARASVTDGYENKVVVVPFMSFKDALHGPSMEKAMNEQASQGWRVTNVIRGRVSHGFGGGAGDGAAITFERSKSP